MCEFDIKAFVYGYFTVC